MKSLIPVMFVVLLVVACSSETPAPAPATAAPPGVPQSQEGLVTVTGRAPRGTVVSLEPTSGEPPPPPAEPIVMDQRGQQFLPNLLVARAGQPVEFRNGEGIAHNVYVTSAIGGAVEFNVSTDPFQAHTHTFTQVGAYNVSCDIHPSMYASVVIVGSPFSAVSGDFGSYQIMNVPPGSYRLVAIAGDSRTERPVDVAGTHATLDAAGR